VGILWVVVACAVLVVAVAGLRCQFVAGLGGWRVLGPEGGWLWEMVAGVDRGVVPAIFCGMSFPGRAVAGKGKEVISELAESAEVGGR